MPEYLIIRLHPPEPMAPGDFTGLLNSLSIAAFDVSFLDPVGGVQLGTAAGLADPHLLDLTDNSVDITATSILQHYVDIPPLGAGQATRELESVATAVILVTGQVAAEYPTPTSYDLRLVITRNGMPLPAQRLHYNVEVQAPAAPETDQKLFFGMPPSAFVELPAGDGFAPGSAFVDLPPGGEPPPFDQLVVAIDLVLAGDPGGIQDTLVGRAPLTAAQSRHIAAEIVWNRVAFPPPELDLSLGLEPFGALYTDPPVDPSVTEEDVQTARPQFESAQSGYDGTREAEVLRLAGFVFSAGAAVKSEIMSRDAKRARLRFPLITGAAATPQTVQQGSVVLDADPNPNGLQEFVVPAAFFYALAAALPSAVSPAQRYDMARLAAEQRLLDEFAAAVESGAITAAAQPPLTIVGAAVVNADQAARRLIALGPAPDDLAVVPFGGPINPLVTTWLAHNGPTDGLVVGIDAAFWAVAAAAQANEYLLLVLYGITRRHDALILAIQGVPHNVTNVAGLVLISDQGWRDFFLGPSPPPGQQPRLNLLPPFTAPGTPIERVAAFIQHLRTFFQVPFSPPLNLALGAGLQPTLALSSADVFAAFTASYDAGASAPFRFDTAPDVARVQSAAQVVFPSDPDAQEWLYGALSTILLLVSLTAGAPPELRFSIMEALYARGFTIASQIASLSAEEFQSALAGTIAFSYAGGIYAAAIAAAGRPQSEAPPPPGPFIPVNPDGSLVDCVPPPHLSPLGPTQYLHELLQISAQSTCNDPFPPGLANTLAALLNGRRGPVGTLSASRANLETPVPVIDLVNESLEALTAGLPAATGGGVFDTATDTLSGHPLAAAGVVGGTPYAHDPQTLFATLPEHSSPATPVAARAAYNLLRSDFTHPNLPYPQGLDISRSYLHALGSSRFSAIRHFRKNITEFAVDPANEPADFQRHTWRYPVRQDIAAEFLGVSPEEYNLLYAQDIADIPGGPQLVLYEVYGFPSDIVDGQPWTDVVLDVAEFLTRTGLTYCEFVELWQSGFIPFGRELAPHEPGNDETRAFPGCQPCCPDDLVIDFGVDPAVPLRKLAVFIRLWRRLQSARCLALTFAQLRDVADILHLFRGDAINPGFLGQLAAMGMLRELLCLPLTDSEAVVAVDAIGADLTHLLALWVGPTATFWPWALVSCVGVSFSMW